MIYRRWIGGLLVLVYSVGVVAQTDDACSEPDTTVVGSVQVGETFLAPLTPRLIFLLEPETHPQNPRGWRIQVSDSLGGSDFVMVATPPYRSSNPRYLDTSYGISAAEAVAWTPRTFRFVLSQDEYETMHAAIATLLWPGDKIEGEIAEAREIISSMPTGVGTFRITSAQVSEATEALPLGRIEEVSFEVDLCLSGR